jgi:hypothetical protein
MHPKQKNVVLIFVGAGIALCLGAVIFVLVMTVLQMGRENEGLAKALEEERQKNTLPIVEDQPPAQDTPAPIIDETTVATDEFGSYTMFANGGNGELKNYSREFENSPIEVQWNKGAKKISKSDTLVLLQKIDKTFEHSDFTSVCDMGSTECYVHAYELGKITSPEKLNGKILYLFALPSPGMGMYYGTYLAFFEEKTNKYIVIEKNLVDHKPEVYEYGEKRFLTGGIIFNNIVSLEKSKTLSFPGTDSILQFVKSESPENMYTTFSPSENRGGIIDIEKNTVIDYSRYNKNNLAFTDPKYGPVYLYNRGYHIILPDGSVQIYELIPSFLKALVPEGADKNLFSNRYEAKITWTDGRKNENETYMIGGDINMGGCVAGIKTCTNIVNANPWFQEKNLVVVGKTHKGESIYEMSDGLNKYYKELFDFGYAASKLYPNQYSQIDAKPSMTQDQLDAMTDAEKFKDFLLDHPLFFWKDQTGNWRIYQKAKYQSMVECGKPVIYLYPTKETNVHVEVKPLGGFTVTEPAYGTNGWDVRATPSGKLTNLADQKAYPYLFWEGIGYNYAKPTQGFVLKRENVQTEMKKILGRLGLNETEQKDFLEFWAPKLETKPFVFVTFIDQKEFDKIAPLTVSPKPDSVIRVFMDYTPLEKEVTVAPLNIKTPERKGFTVVEWGGALHK